MKLDEERIRNDCQGRLHALALTRQAQIEIQLTITFNYFTSKQKVGN